MPRLLTPGAFVSPQCSDCLLKLFTISFFYKWLSCLEKGRLLLWISALRSSVKYSFDLSVIVLTKIYLHFCVHSSTLISSRIEVANYSGSISVIFLHLLSCSLWVLAFTFLVNVKTWIIIFPMLLIYKLFSGPVLSCFGPSFVLYYWSLLDLSVFHTRGMFHLLWVFSGTSKDSSKAPNHSLIIPQEFVHILEEFYLCTFAFLKWNPNISYILLIYLFQ